MLYSPHVLPKFLCRNKVHVLLQECARQKTCHSYLAFHQQSHHTQDRNYLSTLTYKAPTRCKCCNNVKRAPRSIKAPTQCKRRQEGSNQPGSGSGARWKRSTFAWWQYAQESAASVGRERGLIDTTEHVLV